jgi:cytochrome c oxidase subunit 1
VISEVIAYFSRKRIFGYPFVAMSSLGIAIIGFIVWGHHMYTTGQSAYANIVFSILTYVVAVPSAIKVFNWTATMYKGSVSMDTPMVYAMCFMGLFLIGGLTGLFCANLGLDIHIHDTYFIVAHFHYVMVGSAMFAYLAGIHFWFPKMTGRMYPEGPAKFAAIVVFVGFNLTFFPQFILGYLGMPRRYHFYPEEWQVLNVLSSGGAMTLGTGILISMLNLGWSLVYGAKAAMNPWMAKGLEWEQAESPPITANFESPVVVTEQAYNYPSQVPSPAAHH